MTVDELLRRVAAQPEVKQVRKGRQWGPVLRAEVESGRLRNLADIFAHPDQMPTIGTYRYGHLLGEGLSADDIAAWQATFPDYVLPSDLVALLTRVNGVHLWADLDRGRAYFGIAPLEEWGDATARWRWLFEPPSSGKLVISYHDNGDYCLVLDASDSAYWWYDHENPGHPLRVGGSVEELLDWLWVEAQKRAPS